jgi:hypothetical protein
MKQFIPQISKSFAITGFLAFSVLAVAPAQAVILDFESIPAPSNVDYFTGSYTEKGFNISNSAPNQSDALYSWRAGSVGYTGSRAFFNIYGNTTTTLSQIGGGAFDVSSIDLANVQSNGILQSVTFSGLKADNINTVTQSFTSDGTKNLQTLNFSGFNDLVSLSWYFPLFEGLQFDNINVTPTASAAAVPEPFTIIGTLIGGTAAVRMKKKLGANK